MSKASDSRSKRNTQKGRRRGRAKTESFSSQMQSVSDNQEGSDNAVKESEQVMSENFGGNAAGSTKAADLLQSYAHQIQVSPYVLRTGDALNSVSKEILNAIRHYARTASAQNVIGLYDTSSRKDGSEGYLFTTDTAYRSATDSAIAYSEIVKV